MILPSRNLLAIPQSVIHLPHAVQPGIITISMILN